MVYEFLSGRLERRLLAAAWACGLGLLIVQPVAAQWSISTYQGTPTTGEIINYDTADALIGGAFLDPAYPVTANYALANTQDNNDAGGPFGLGTQIEGLPAGDNNDFVFVGVGQLNVQQTGTYVFVTNTDDGSRVQASVNGGEIAQWVNDNVLSGPHDAPSEGISLASGDVVDFNWMWFERGGGAEGEFYYRVDTGAGFGPNALIGDSAQGLELVGGALSGTVYKSIVTPGQLINNFAEAQVVIDTPGTLKGTELRDVFNIVGGGADADFPGGQPAPGLVGDVNDYVAVGTGMLVVGPGQAGAYVFRSNTDDGGRLKIDLNQDGSFDEATEWVINQDVLQGPTNFDSAEITLAEGSYMVEYSLFERAGGDEGEVSARLATGNIYYLLGDDAAGGLDVVPIPEPSSILLSLLGMLSLLGLRRRG